MPSVWKDKNFILMASANLISEAGSGITMIGVPWYLVSMAGGEKSFGIATLITTTLTFLLSQYTGVIVDRHSRKRLHITYDAVAFILIGLFSLWSGLGFHVNTAALIFLFMIGFVYYAFHYPTIFALRQEIFAPNQFRQVNGIIEVLGQASSLLSGAIASVLITKWGLSFILLIDALTYLVSFILYTFITYSSSIGKIRRKTGGLGSEFIEGWRYLKERPRLILLFFTLFVPFITVMVTNYVFPVYVSKTLHSGPTTYAIYEILYSIGAIIAGLTVNMLTKKFGAFQSLLLTLTIFTLAIWSIGLIPFIPVFLAMQVLLGWGGSGTRVNRSTLMMEMIPNYLIGRVSSFYTTVGLGVRILLIAVFTSTITSTGAIFSINILGFFTLISLAIFITVKRGLRETTEEV